MSYRQRGGIMAKFLFLLTLGLLVGVLYLVRHPLMRAAGQYWVVTDAIEDADAIIVLGDDNFRGDRALRAAELFRAERAPVVVASGRMLRPHAGVAELIARDLEQDGVPASAILAFPNMARNTIEEARALRTLAGEQGWRRVIVVTSNYHSRRARYIFRKVFPPERVTVVPAADSDFLPGSWWERRQGRKLFFLESVGYCVAWWELRDAEPPQSLAPAESSPVEDPAESLAPL